MNICPAPADPPEASGVRPSSARDSRTFWLAGGAVALVLVAFVGWATISPAEPQAAQAGTPTELRQREILELNLGKSGDPVLVEQYSSLNARHFKGGLPAIPVRWESRLSEIDALSGGAFKLDGLFGHVGSKAVILLNPAIQGDTARVRRALCHEMVHAQLYATGQATEKHGPAFQSILRRLSAEGAFEGIVATDEDRANLKSWLDAETSRLDGENETTALDASDLDRERIELEAAMSTLNARMNTAAAPDAAELHAFNTRRERYNWRVSQAKERVERERADREYLNREIDRYNLMLVYPDGMDGTARTKK